MAGQENFEDQFENQWRDAFEGMEETPPSAVWNEIDRHLAYEELAVYKSRVAYYRWSAAAILLLAAFLGTVYFFTDSNLALRDQVAQQVEVDRPAEQPIAPKVEVPDQSHTGGEGGSADARTMAFTSESKETTADQTFSNQRGSSTGPLVASDQSGGIDEAQFHEFVIDKLNPELLVAANYEGKEIYKVATYDFHETRKRKNSADGDKFWAGVGMGGGSFDPNFQAGESSLAQNGLSNSFSLASNDVVDGVGPEVREDMSAGQTVALGLNFGVKVSDRWSLESGFQYVRSDATTTTNVVIETSSIREVIPASSEVKNVPKVQRAMQGEAVLEYDYQDVDMANQFQFATIPIKAGYLVLDRKFTVELNAGVAANVYLGNKLTADSPHLASGTFGPGSSSPYRDLSFSGLAGVQLGYEFLRNFDLVVEPNYRRSINSLTKDKTTFTATPSGFGVMTGIRFRFN